MTATLKKIPTADEMATMPGAPAFIMDLKNQVERIDRRLKEITSEEKPGDDAPAPSLATRAALTKEREQLTGLRTIADGLLREAARQGLSQIEDFKSRRNAVIKNSHEILKSVVDKSRLVDKLAKDLVVALAEREQHLQELAPLLSADDLKRYSRHDIISQALGRAGLRKFVTLPGAFENDRLRLGEHAEQLVAADVRNEVLRHRPENKQA